MSNYHSLDQIRVNLDFGRELIPVGRLAERNHKIYFEYFESFVDLGLEVSPFKLPLDHYGLFSFDPHLFDGLPGVFNDSLPDGWGRLLIDRYLRSQNILPEEFTPLDRLAHVGYGGLGALVYEPDHSEQGSEEKIDLDMLAKDTQEAMNGRAEDVLHRLIELNGSSAGARPKALIGAKDDHTEIIHGKHTLPPEYKPWIVKFANSTDGNDAGAIEYVYSIMAREAGVEMSETYLFPATKGGGYFATRRFDRMGTERLHMHTASGLLHANYRTPSLDYEDLISLTEVLTKDVREVEKMFRLAVFNVLSHNRDDHGKNFSFLMNEQGEWRLAPAYDLTFSSGPRGHQSTMVMGEGETPSFDHLLKLGAAANLKKDHINRIIEQTIEALKKWKALALNHGVSKANITFIASRMQLR